jgi:hypothetical protein
MHIFYLYVKKSIVRYEIIILFETTVTIQAHNAKPSFKKRE